MVATSYMYIYMYNMYINVLSCMYISHIYIWYVYMCTFVYEYDMYKCIYKIQFHIENMIYTKSADLIARLFWWDIVLFLIQGGEDS